MIEGKPLNAVEIEEAISELAEQAFDAASFPYAFLEAFGNKATTIQRLKTGSTNKSDLGGVLQTNNIHIAVCAEGKVNDTLQALNASPATARAKAKFTLATDGITLEAKDLSADEIVVCDYADFPNHFGFFLPLAGITTVKQIRENSFDIRATSRLNRLYVELLRGNPEWGTAARRHDMNHFMARLIFCFFAEDTEIFNQTHLFTGTLDQMSERDASNTHEVIGEIFRAMNTKTTDRQKQNIRPWANKFPYVNGGLFSGSTEVPLFSKLARSYLVHVGSLDWKQINPDIFGSMIQAVADDEERGALGMHYTSVPNILKVLNPLFLDDLREQLTVAGDNARKLLNLRNRLTKIRVFDPACGSGNFLVIAYKQMREIEAKINERRGEKDRPTDIPLTNFRGIELRDFSAEIARLALVIAEYQCDLIYRGYKLAMADFLPLDSENWITCGNALRVDWLSVCPPTGTGVKFIADDLFGTPLDQAQIDFDNEGGETYICGNPPYVWTNEQTIDQKKDLERIFSDSTRSWKSLNYVSAWFKKAADYGCVVNSSSAFVSINTICQGQQLPILWPIIFDLGCEIFFAHTSFKWKNLAAKNAGVTVVIVGITNNKPQKKQIYCIDENGKSSKRQVDNINAYLIEGTNIIVKGASNPIGDKEKMFWGNKPTDGGNFIFDEADKEGLERNHPEIKKYIRKYYGSHELIHAQPRYCFWVTDDDRGDAEKNIELKRRIEGVKEMRASSKAKSTRDAAAYPHRFRQIQDVAKIHSIVVPAISSESRYGFPVDLLPNDAIISSRNFVLYDAALWNFSLIASQLHLAWLSTVCGRLEMRYSYSNTIGWNSFPVPKLTETNKTDLTRCAEDILLAREVHFPATIADLYKPENMPDNLRAAHERNDEVLERIYIGRRFRNDTERLERLFELYTRMTADQKGA